MIKRICRVVGMVLCSFLFLGPLSEAEGARKFLKIKKGEDPEVAIKKAMKSIGATEYEYKPLFKPSPKGQRNPKAHEEIGISRWFTVTYKISRDADPGFFEVPDSVERVDEDGPIELFATPNDPMYKEKQWNLPLIKADKAWDIVTDTSEVLVFVVDTGVQGSHKDLAANLWVNKGEIPDNGIDDDNNGFIDDVHGYDFSKDRGSVEARHFHGTHVSGTVGAVGDNGLQVSGVAWKATIGQSKIFSYASGGWELGAQGIVYAVEQGAQILNNSWGGSRLPPEFLHDAVKYAAACDVLIIAAAGNTGRNGKNYPAAYPEVMAVVSIDSKSARSKFSTYGSWVDISAPGSKILSLVLKDKVQAYNGTSMASPHVAGVASMVYSVNPELTAVQVRKLLNETSDELGKKGFDPEFGHGRLNAYAAVKKAIALKKKR